MTYLSELSLSVRPRSIPAVLSVGDDELPTVELPGISLASDLLSIKAD